MGSNCTPPPRRVPTNSGMSDEVQLDGSKIVVDKNRDYLQNTFITIGSGGTNGTSDDRDPSRKRLAPALLPSPSSSLLFAGAARRPTFPSLQDLLRYYERELAGGNKERSLRCTVLSADATNWGDPLAFHFYGWGGWTWATRAFGKESGRHRERLPEILHPGNAQMKLGRFFLTAGSAMETLDGPRQATTPIGLGFALRRRPGEQSILNGTSVGAPSTAAGSSSPGRSSRSAPRISWRRSFQEGRTGEVGGDLCCASPHR